MPQKISTSATPARKAAPRKASGDNAIREMVRERAPTGGGPVTIPTTDSKHQAHVRQLVEKMRDGKDGKPYVVEASADGSRVTVSLPLQPA